VSAKRGNVYRTLYPNFVFLISIKNLTYKHNVAISIE
jgi:hypothetical protein